MKDISQLINELANSVVTIEFEKIDTKEIRIMPCTNNVQIANTHVTISSQSATNDTIVAYALDKKAWRDVRVSTIKDWYQGYPKET